MSSQHWYDKTGQPCYEQETKAGGTRPTTLRDARIQNLYPSVTTVMQVAASPGLEVYKTNQLLDACIASPPDFWDKGAPEVDQWRKKIVAMSKQHAKDAAAKGSEVHDQLEEFFKTGSHNNPDLIDNVMKVFLSPELFACDDWIAEASFASPLGFAGKVDLHSPNHSIVLDFKTKSDDNFAKAKPYDSHHMQLAAYATGLFGDLCIEDIKQGFMEPELVLKNLPKVKCYNLFINVDNYKQMNLTESEDLDKAWKQFYTLLRYWQLTKNYKAGEL